ncbi:MAG: 4-(cytidine 5'-diphospho)-2-C-methyl-D-erythritol kinase [Solobacterium sp.]|nr:4-(cytidine 5'-diphospho)-2-C-methyl-D-erythritol kinase [Solobacterium sp.]
MKERAYAKINLCLDIASRRDDGYHELKMIMVPLDFYDVLEMNRAPETTISLNKSFLPVNEKNTVIKAISVMQERYGFEGGFACDLTKHIPTRAGLAGGSADAAAAIRMICRMLKISPTVEELIGIGREVGSDVPFCIFNKPSLVQGTGDRLEPFVCRTPFEILLVKPQKGVSTKEAFELADHTEYTHPDVDTMRTALENNDYERVIASLGNSLEPAAITLVKEIRTVKERLIEEGFDGVLMSGSGSTVFALTRDAALTERVMMKMRKEHYFVRRTRILNGGRI